MRVRVIGVLYSCSWAAEKLFKQRGHFQTFIWCTESQDGRSAIIRDELRGRACGCVGRRCAAGIG